MMMMMAKRDAVLEGILYSQSRGVIGPHPNRDDDDDLLIALLAIHDDVGPQVK